MSASDPTPPKPADPEAKDPDAPRSGVEALIEGVKSLLRLRNGGSLRTELGEVLAGSKAETEFSPAERAMLRNILRLRDRRLGDVMVPRADIVAVQQEIALGELLKVFASAGHSRLVVYNDTLDDPVGMAHIRDLVAHMTERASLDPAKNARRRKPAPAGLDLKLVDLATSLSATRITRRILFAPPSMPVVDLLVRMQATRIHLALVIDEYGGTDGLVSMEDIVELIVGDIADEHDYDETPHIMRQSDGSFLADARAGLEDVTATIGAEFDVGEAAEDVDTLGGYLVMKAGRVPVRGELVPGPGTFEIEVLDADPRRVKRVRIYRSKDRLTALARDQRRRAAESGSPLVPSDSAPAEAAAERDQAANPSSDVILPKTVRRP